MQQFYNNKIRKPLLSIYLKQDLRFNYDGLKLKIFKGVFHPKYFFSSTFFYDFLKPQNLTSKKFIEIGCGSGLLSLLAYKLKATVTAIDIDSNAINCTKKNFEANFGETHAAQLFLSDVFNNLSPFIADIICVNPPYFFNEAIAASQLAWNCGKNGEFFEKFFSKLHLFANNNTQVFMILASNCEIERIKKMANTYNITFVLVKEKKIKWENNFIFKLQLNG